MCGGIHREVPEVPDRNTREDNMPTVFDTISEKFYTAYFESDVEKRRKAIERWVDSSVPVIQKAIKIDLRSHLEQILETRWTTEGWQNGVKKFMRIMDSYRLVMNIQIADIRHKKYIRTVAPVSPDDRAKTLHLVEVVLSKFDEAEAAKVSAERKKASVSDPSGGSGSDDETWNGRGGPSPNDQRSDVMNPSNPAHQAAADNRSNQMNPNNPAYHSSRGHGRR